MKLLQKIPLLVLAVFILVIAMLPQSSFAQSDMAASVVPITSLDQLNQALGGVHTVNGNKISLEDDVLMDTTIEIQLPEPLILDLNGKRILYDREDAGHSGIWGLESAFILKSNATIDGNGAIETTKHGVAAIEMVGCTLTVNNGTIKTLGGDSPTVVVNSFDKDLSTIIINGGTLTSKRDFAIDSRNGAIADVQINNGSINGSIILKQPYSKDMAEFSGKNKLEVNGGTVHKIFCGSTLCNIKSGTVSQGLWSDYSDITMSGGTVSGSGVLVEYGNFTMTKGKIYSTDKQGLKLDASSSDKQTKYKSHISGGTITTSKKDARGITFMGNHEGNAELKLSGGTIRSTSKNSSGAGIYALGKNITVLLQGTPGGTGYIKDYKYGLCKKRLAQVSLGKNTRVYAPKSKKAGYTKGQKIPQNIIGNVTIKYTGQ